MDIFLTGFMSVLLLACQNREIKPEVDTECFYNGVDTCNTNDRPWLLKLDPSLSYQTIHSFGASDCWTAKFIGTWASENKKDQIADLLFSTDTLEDGRPKGIGLSLWRFNIGAGSFEQGAASGIRTDWRREESFQNADGSYDWGKQKGQQWFLEAARERGVRYTLGFSISPPVHMTRNGKAFSAGGKSLNLQPGKMKEFAAFLAGVAGHFKFDYLSPVNEPQWDWSAGNGGASQEGTPATNAEISQLVKLLSEEISAGGAETEIVVGEAGQWEYLYDRNEDGRGKQASWFFAPGSSGYIGDLPGVLDVISGHSYWTTCPESTLTGVRRQVADAVAAISPAPRIWQTEFGILGNICDRYSGSPRNTGIDYGLYVANVIHHDLTVTGVSSWQWWLAMSPYDYSDALVYINDPAGNISPETSKEDGIVLESKQLWAMGNFSRFIRPGMQRVAASVSKEGAGGGDAAGESAGTSAGDLLVSAYRDAASSKLVVVIINKATAGRSLQLPGSLSGAPLMLYTTDKERNLEPSRVAGEAIDLAPRSVTTLIAAQP